MSTTHRAGDASDLPVRRIDRILAFMSLGLLVLSIVCFIAIIAGTAMHATFNVGVWPTIGVVVYIAPIIAFILLMVVLVSSMVRRARANRATTDGAGRGR
jgi:FtsH-binding integral membrane protein